MENAKSRIIESLFIILKMFFVFLIIIHGCYHKPYKNATKKYNDGLIIKDCFTSKIISFRKDLVILPYEEITCHFYFFDFCLTGLFPNVWMGNYLRSEYELCGRSGF